MKQGSTSLGRVLAVLDTFSEDRPEQSLGEIVARAELPAPTVHRYLAELVAWGGLERTGRGRYAIGTRLWQIGALAPKERHLRDIALPVLEDLFETTHEVVHLVVEDDGRALYIEKLTPRQRSTVSSHVGLRLPLHATGPGKVLLAFGSRELQEQVLSGPLTKHASRTITDPAVLRRTLGDIRATGFTISRDEMTEGNASAAAPIFGPRGTAIAAISVVVPSAHPNLAALANAVRMAAAVISRAMRASSR